MTLLLGAIADDFTGATDLASMLTRAGMRTILNLDPPASGEPLPEAEAVVVALKSRTAPVAEAVADSLSSWRWMAAGGARQCYFKYCSTFDSTPQGNIGPVAEALMAETGATQTIYCPAFPENGRTIYQGKAGFCRRSFHPARRPVWSPSPSSNKVPGRSAPGSTNLPLKASPTPSSMP
jgi:uncharacterized protein YgbK (DUF1537 family)